MKQLTYSRIGIVHGINGSSATHWQTWLDRKCKAAGAETHYPKLPQNNKPKLSAWLEAFERAMPVIDKTTALVAHSMGCHLVLNRLAKPEIERVGLVILVAPPSYGEVLMHASNLPDGSLEGISDIFLRNMAADASKVAAQKADKVVIFASDNDSWSLPQSSFALALEMHAYFHLIPNTGHMNVASGQHTFPEVLHALTK